MKIVNKNVNLKLVYMLISIIYIKYRYNSLDILIGGKKKRKNSIISLRTKNI